jgi:cation diffusion facilitator CzcD-associated flavoprotein CzcO
MRQRRALTVAILGAGAGGIAMAIECKGAGFAFVIFESSDGFGGTWRHNTYPGAACDVPSHLYSFSFAPNPHWSRTYATQPEILAYLEKVADDHDLGSHLQSGTAIVRADWEAAEQHWQLTSESGDRFVADVIVSGLGMLNVPFVPAIPGAGDFHGRTFHSSQWDHSKPLAGERVASIGTGASAVQYVPAIAAEVDHLTVFQRTPIWIAPRLDVEYTDDQKADFERRPATARKHRRQIWLSYERSSFQVSAEQTQQATALARSYLARKVEDPELRALLTPDYPAGCKRPLTSRTWFPALTRPNVALVTSPITSITESGLRTADGVEHPVDTIIYGTGFVANEYLTTIEIRGRDGQMLSDRWKDGAEAYLGIAVDGFPNFFMLYGPNTNGINSILFMHEAQAHYIGRALRIMRRRRLGSLEIKPSVLRAYNKKVQAAMAGTVWLAGCSNYYTAPSGKVVTQLPYSGGRYWLRSRIVGTWRYRKQRRVGRGLTMET